MKKGILITLVIGLLSICVIAFAYTPSAELEKRLETVVTKIETVIDVKGEPYRSNFITALNNYKVKYASNQRARYILDYLLIHISKSGGTNVSVATSNYTGEYTINDSKYGTKVEVTIDGDIRTIKANALPDHETGSFPNSGNPNTISAQNKTYSLDYTPNYKGGATWTRESGVAYNGVKFELETAERVECSSGENYRIEAIQDMVNLGLDSNNAHVQPTGEYHYHGIADVVADNLEGDNIVHIGYANDGFPLMYSKNGSYTSSYVMKNEKREGTSCSYRGKNVVVNGTTTDGTYGSDWEYKAGLGNLDSCNGTYVDGEYVYFITETFPYGPRCLNGEVKVQTRPAGGPGTQGGARGERQGPPPRR